MTVDEQTCPVCERRRDDHDPACGYERTLYGQGERLAEAQRVLVREVGRSFQAERQRFERVTRRLREVMRR